MGRSCTDDDALAAITMIIDDGIYIRDASKRLGVDYSSMLRKLATPEYKPLADEARIGAAETQERLAKEALEAIPDDASPGTIQRQVRLADHFWKSAKVRDPRSYGDKVQHDLEAGGTITIKIAHFSEPVRPTDVIDVDMPVDKLGLDVDK